jgi:hypothetical protein
VTAFESTRKITLTLVCLRHLLRGRRSKLSDPRLAELLNAAQKDQARPFALDGNLVNKIRHGRYTFHGREEAQLIAALQSICTEHTLGIDLSQPLPQWVEDSYSRELPDILARPGWLPLQGQPLGGVATSLAGLWRFMYFSPVDRQGKFKPEIRGTAAIFQHANESATTIDCLLVSKNTRWKGHAFVNESHMYLLLTDVTKVETAFFVTNKPSTNETLITGVGAALERDHARRRKARRPPVAGFVCFGEKLSPNMDYPGKAAVQRVQGGEELRAEDEQVIREAFCKTLTEKLLEQKHPSLFAYLNGITINNAPGLSSSPSLYLAYE